MSYCRLMLSLIEQAQAAALAYGHHRRGSPAAPGAAVFSVHSLYIRPSLLLTAPHGGSLLLTFA